MWKIHSVFALAGLALGSLGAACGSDDSGSEVVTFSCRYPTNDACFEFTGPSSSVNGAEEPCVQFGGMPGTGCARHDVSGSCAFPRDGSRAVFYGMSSEDLTLVKQVCEDSNGVWSAS